MVPWLSTEHPVKTLIGLHTVAQVHLTESSLGAKVNLLVLSCSGSYGLQCLDVSSANLIYR